MAQLRLDQVQAAFSGGGNGQLENTESSKKITSPLITLDAFQLYGREPDINRGSYDTWWEKMVEGMTTAENPVLDFAGEPTANLLNSLPSITNSLLFSATDIAGNVMEGFSSKEKFVKNLSELPVIAEGIDIAQAVGNLYDLIAGPGTFDERASRSQAFIGKELADQEKKKERFSLPPGVSPEEEFTPSPNANMAEKVGKKLRSVAFYAYAHDKAFKQNMANNANFPFVSQLGGVAGSITTSALLASVNPKLALAAIGGSEGANFYLEQTSRGVDWKPALGYGALIGGAVSKLEQMSINVLFKKYSSRMALAADSAVANMLEEFSQSVTVSGIEQFTGAEDRSIGEILKQGSYEGILGMIGGGVAGMTTVQMAYNRMDKGLRDNFPFDKPTRHKIIMRTFADGESIVKNILMEGFGATDSDLDLVEKINKGEGDANALLFELSKRIFDREAQRGIDTRLSEEDVDGVIEEQRAQDQVEDSISKGTASVDEKIAADEQLSPDEQKVKAAEEKLLREGRQAQIDAEMKLMEEELDNLHNQLEQRKKEGKPTKAIEQKIDAYQIKFEELFDEIATLPDQQREDLAKKIVKTKGQKISSLKNKAEKVAERIERDRVTQLFKKKASDLKEARAELLKYIRTVFKGIKVLPKKFLTRAAQVTPKNIDEYMREVDAARTDIVRPLLIRQIQKVLNRIAPKVENGKLVGKIKSDAAMQDAANEIIRLSKLDAITTQQLIRQKQKQMVEGVGDVDKLAFELGLLQNVAGLDGKSEADLLDALEYVKIITHALTTTSKMRHQALKEAREREREKILDEMPVEKFDVARFVPKWTRSWLSFSVDNLSSMLRNMIGVQNIKGSVLEGKIKALDEAPRKRDSFRFYYADALDQVAKRIFGFENDKQYNDWKHDRFKAGSGYDSGENVQMNDGTSKRILLSKADVTYWWMVTHDSKGNEISELVEHFTNEHQRADIEKKAIDEEWSEEQFQEELAKIRGNAIPSEHWQSMMEQFAQDIRNIEFAQSQRLLYNTVYSLVNPVYRLYMGTDLPRVNDYIPWWRDVSGVETDVFDALSDINDLVAGTPKSFNLRTPGATAAFRQVGDLEIFNYFINEMAHFYAFALPMKDIISIVRHPDIREAINLQTDGTELADGVVRDGDTYLNLRRMVDLVSSQGRSLNEFTNKIFNTIRSNLSVAYLGEPSKGLLQFSSMWMALTENDITWADWTKGFLEFMSDIPGSIKFLEQAPMMKFRYSDMMIEMKDAMEQAKQVNEGKVSKLRRFITPKAFAFVRAGNKIGAGISGYVVMKKVYDETGDINEAFRRFDQHILNTQQSAISTQVSPFQVGQMSRLLAQFQSATIQYARLYTRSITDYFKGRIPLKKMIDNMIVFHVLMPAMRWLLKALIRGGDFDRDELARDALIGPLTPGLFVFDLIGGLISSAMSVYSYGFEGAFESAGNKAVKASRKLFKGFKDAVAGDAPDFLESMDMIIEFAEEFSAPTLPIPGIVYDLPQAVIQVLAGELEPLELLSVIMGESPESLKFKNSGGKNNRRNKTASR